MSLVPKAVPFQPDALGFGEKGKVQPLSHHLEEACLGLWPVCCQGSQPTQGMAPPHRQGDRVYQCVSTSCDTEDFHKNLPRASPRDTTSSALSQEAVTSTTFSHQGRRRQLLTPLYGWDSNLQLIPCGAEASCHSLQAHPATQLEGSEFSRQLQTTWHPLTPGKVPGAPHGLGLPG